MKDWQQRKLIGNAVLSYLMEWTGVLSNDFWTLEIDFIRIKNNTKTYFQSAFILKGLSIINIDLGNPQNIDDNYPKMVISMETQTMNTIEGIEHWNLLRFLEKFE